MFKSSRSSSFRHHHLSGWRDYQAGLKRRTPRRFQRPRPLGRILLGLLVIAALFRLTAMLRGGPDHSTERSSSPVSLASSPSLKLPAAEAMAAPEPEPVPAPAVVVAPLPVSDTPVPPIPAPAPVLAPEPVLVPELERGVPAVFDREHLQQFLDPRAFSNLSTRDLVLPVAGRQFKVETTLDPGLQSFLLSAIDRTNSRYVGIVAMDATSGKVLAMAGYDRTDSGSNPCLRSEFPAASIFKIVTAATAVDQLGYSADTPMTFSGPKHTLYKQQLTDKVKRKDPTIPLREAFGDSINPVFGKLGILRLRKNNLEQAAAKFGFNQSLSFELPLEPSRFRISDEPYNWAEIASGFNLDTTLSPLHGAALVAGILNGGRMPTPSIIEEVADAQGKELYRRTSTLDTRTIMSSRAASAMVRMMETTIESGTARKAFRNAGKDRVLSGLQLGGKTGSLDSASHDLRYDWFVGFARERQREKQMVVAVMVAHHKFIGIRAGDYARRAFTYYFAPSETKR